MKVSINWLKDLVGLNISIDELLQVIPMKVIGIKEATNEFFELDMKGYNRPDLLSMRGVAREIAAITDSKVTFDEEPLPGYNLPETETDIEDSKLCPVYCLAKIEGLKAGPSNPGWVKKLNDCGMRSVNNIADVTNLIMLEFGQPMHSFDADKVADKKIIVRKAKPGEKIITLDDKDRILNEDDLVIADNDKALGIAGVMGGKNCEATDSTTTILLEAAIFDPVSIRKTSQKLGLYSEASKRFQHGLTKQNLLQALTCALQMYEKMGGKVTAISLKDLSGNFEDETKTVLMRPRRMRSLIGVEISDDEAKKSLEKLGFRVNQRDSWEVTPPYFRLDINIEEDLIEEVARIYGYDKIPAKPLEGEPPQKIDQSLFETIYKLKEILVNEGLIEVQTYSFYSTDVLKNLGFFPDDLDSLVRIANPISSQTQYMRKAIWQNLVEVIEKNVKKYAMDDIAVFEIGKVYSLGKDSLPDEEYSLSIALMSGDNPIEELFAILKNALEKTEHQILVEDSGKDRMDKIQFHPKRFKFLKINNETSGVIAEVHPRTLDKFGLEKRLAILEISVKELA